MTWWLEGAISKHFGWVRNPLKVIFYIFLESGKKSKKIFFQKIDFFLPIFFPNFSTAKSFSGPSKSDFSPKNRPISTIFLSLVKTAVEGNKKSGCNKEVIV